MKEPIYDAMSIRRKDVSFDISYVKQKNLFVTKVKHMPTGVSIVVRYFEHSPSLEERLIGRLECIIHFLDYVKESKESNSNNFNLNPTKRILEDED